MKRMTTLIIALVMVSCSNDNKNNIYPVPLGELKLENLVKLETNIPQDFYDDLIFTTDQTGYAISRIGKIVKTTDGGLSWTILNAGVTSPLKKIHFINSDIGFAVGNDQNGSYVLKTTNAGQTWTNSILSTSTNSAVNSIYFKNESIGFVVGNQIFKKTLDGGQTWSDITSIPTDKSYQDIKFQKQSNIGYATFNTNAYYETTDGGISWSMIETNFLEENFKQIQIIDGQLYLKSNSKIINISDDRTTMLPNPVNKVLYLNDSKAIGIGQHYEGGFFPYGDIMLTNNNWIHFLQKTYQPSGEAMDFTAIAKMTDHKIMILGTGQLHTEVIVLEIE